MQFYLFKGSFGCPYFLIIKTSKMIYVIYIIIGFICWLTGLFFRSAIFDADIYTKGIIQNLINVVVGGIIILIWHFL